MADWVLMFVDGRAAYATGDTPEEAKRSFGDRWIRNIAAVVPLSQFPDLLPAHLTVTPPIDSYPKEK